MDIASEGAVQICAALVHLSYEARPESERASLDYQVGYARTLFLSDDLGRAQGV